MKVSFFSRKNGAFLYRKGFFMNLQNNRTDKLKKLTFSAMLMAMAFLLPFLTGQIPEIGKALCPMHIPVLLCGFICGWPWGVVVGFFAPILRSLLLHMPPLFPTAFAMAFELAAYGFAAGLLYKLLPKKPLYIYIDLIIAMIFGRIVWGTVMFIISGFGKTSFSFAAFYAGAFTNAIPGIILQIVVIPAIIIALRKTRFMLND